MLVLHALDTFDPTPAVHAPLADLWLKETGKDQVTHQVVTKSSSNVCFCLVHLRCVGGEPRTPKPSPALRVEQLSEVMQALLLQVGVEPTTCRVHVWCVPCMPGQIHALWRARTTPTASRAQRVP